MFFNTKAFIALSLSLSFSACGARTGDLKGPTGGQPVNASRLRTQTVLVKVTPPKEIQETLTKVAALFESTDEGSLIGTSLRAGSRGGHGSGFIVSEVVNGTRRPFVVTNRHVIEESEHASIVFDDGRSYQDCDILASDVNTDIAVLNCFPKESPTLPDGGLHLSGSPVSDLQAVVAAGFPGREAKGSYQITEGKVSNREYKSDSRLKSMTLIQHTAAIDPGSSGGPLLNESGELVGVNTMLLNNAHSVFFAVPASAVRETLAQAINVEARKQDKAWRAGELESSCRTLVEELSSAKPRVPVVEDLIAIRFVAARSDEALVSTIRHIESEPEAMQKASMLRFVFSPMDAMRDALIMDLMGLLKARGGVKTGSCVPHRWDATHITSAEEVNIPIEMARGTVLSRWAFEHGRWRLSNVTL